MRCIGRSSASWTGSTVRDPGQAHLRPRGKPQTTAETSRAVRAARAAQTGAKGRPGATGIRRRAARPHDADPRPLAGGRRRLGLTTVVPRVTIPRNLGQCGVCLAGRTRGGIHAAIADFVGFALVAAVMTVGAAQAANEGNLRLELPSTDFNPCTNELVDSVVKIHIVVTSTANANNISGTFHLNFSLKGVGQTSGASYTGSEADSEPFTASLQERSGCHPGGQQVQHGHKRRRQQLGGPPRLATSRSTPPAT